MPITSSEDEWQFVAAASTTPVASAMWEPAASAATSSQGVSTTEWQVISQKTVERMTETSNAWTVVESAWEKKKALALTPTPKEVAWAEVAARKEWAATLRERRAMAANDKKG